mgnify:FL=1
MSSINIDKPYFDYDVEVINTLKNLINSNIFAFFVVIKFGKKMYILNTILS